MGDSMKTTTWLVGTALATLMMTTATAQAGNIFMANLTGPGGQPATTLPNTGRAFFTLNNDNIFGNYYIEHNITNLPTYARLEVPGYAPELFQNAQVISPFGPYPYQFSSYDMTDKLRAGQHFIELLTAADPAGAIGGYFNQVVFATPADNRARAALAPMLNASGSTHEFNTTLVGLARLPAANQLEAYDQMSGRTLYSQSVQILDSMYGFQSSMLSHANEARPQLGTFSLFVKGGYAVGKRDDTRDQAGASISRPYVVGGVDTTFLPNASAGIAVAYADGTDKFRGGLGQTSVSTIAGLGYVSFDVARIVVQGVIGYGKSEIATTRAMPLLGLAPTSRHNGNGWSLAGRVAMPFVIGPDTTLAPYAQLDSQHASIDSYTEQGSGRFTPNDYKDRDFTVEVGGQLKANLGPAARVRIEAGYRQSIDKGEKAIQTLYVGAPLKFNTAILGRSPAAGKVGVAMSTGVANAISGEVGYQGYISGRMQTHVFEARLTWRM